VATPYKEELNRKEREFLEAHGYDVICIRELSCRGPETADVPYRLVYELAREGFRPEADGHFIRCTDLRTLDILEALGCALNRPGISSNQATMWMISGKSGSRSQ